MAFPPQSAIPYGSTFLLASYPTVYQYNAAEEEFRPMVNMTERPYGGVALAPIIVDLNMFPACTEDDAS